MWVRVTYKGKSVVARVTDDNGFPNLDLSTGLANAVGFIDDSNGGVTISAP